MRKMFWMLTTLVILSGAALPARSSSLVPVSAPASFDPALVKAAFNAFKSLPLRVKKEKLREARREIKTFKAARRSGKEPDTNTLLLAILAILLPPLAVYLHEGETNNKFWITLLLFLLGLAGVIFFSWLLIFAAVVYALIVILS